MKSVWKYTILIAVVGAALAAGWIWFGKARQRVIHEPASAPLARMFEADALRGFVPSTTDVKRDSTVYTLTNSDSVMKIEVLEHIEAADAETLTQDGLMGIEALYANALSPYPTDLSSQVTTDPAFRPRLFRATNAPVSYTYFLLYANDRFGYGATTKDSIKYKSLVGWFYCEPRKEFFKVKLFFPVQAPDDALKTTLVSLGCRQ